VTDIPVDDAMTGAADTDLPGPTDRAAAFPRRPTMPPGGAGADPPRRHGGWWALGLTMLLLGLAATGLVTAVLHAGHRHAADQTMDQRTVFAQHAVAAEVVRYRDAVGTVAAGTGTYERLTAAKFAGFTDALKASKLPGVTSVALIVPASTAQIPPVQRYWRERGLPDLVLRPAPGRTDHMFAIFVNSLDASPAAAPGRDLTTTSVPLADALDRARRSGRYTVTDTYVLYKDRKLPAAQRQYSFAVVAPVYRLPAAGARRGVFTGWTVLVLRGRDFVSSSLRDITTEGFTAALYADNLSGGEVEVVPPAAVGRADLHRSVRVDVADRHWTLRTEADSAQLLPGDGGVLAAALVGALISLLLCLLVVVLVTGRQRAERSVAVATRELARAERESRRQAVLLYAVVDSISDGVTVVDQNGELLLHNPAAVALTGLGTAAPDIPRWSADLNIRRADGTPYPPDELPLVRAMAGEPCDDEMIVYHGPDPVVLLVSCRPLDPSGEQPGAVAVYRDITADRRHADAVAAANERLEAINGDLEAFSYSVSHDLRAPLRSMDGFAEILLEEYGPRLPAEAQDYLGRIRRAAGRMSELIDDLLAFSRLGRQEIETAEVDVGAVARAALETLRHMLTGRVVEIAFADLPPAVADRSLLEQVYGNLLANAIKFSRGKDPAEIAIGAHRDNGVVVYTVSDNGAGFDATKADRLFGVFQRLHKSTEFEGTGVGLALCQRIVQKHGGRIWAVSEPGYGATFSFTLSADPVEPIERETVDTPRRVVSSPAVTVDYVQ
jgi:signal transduction histidine kinase/CHASE1-domain containing sensor protein